jgi:predicted heme/steroid binding protein/uncharacterized membrane protein
MSENIRHKAMSIHAKAFRRLAVALIVLSAAALLPVEASGLPEYSARTGQSCSACHVKPDGGGLTRKGLEYAASGYTWPPTGGYRVIGPIRRPVRLFIGFFHITASFLWFGTILYVHILLRPGYASRGLPRGEVLMGLSSMAVVGITGVLLTISRIRDIGVLFETPWGKLLSAKILIYIIMISTAVFAVTVIGPRLRRAAGKRSLPPEGGMFDPAALSGFDGKDGRPAYIAFRGKVYDVSGLKLWRGGIHMKHNAGQDLTQALAKAPHGEEKLEALKTAGSFDPSSRPPRTPAQHAFYFVAYMNLTLVFAVLFLLSLWRWGI